MHRTFIGILVEFKNVSSHMLLIANNTFVVIVTFIPTSLQNQQQPQQQPIAHGFISSSVLQTTKYVTICRLLKNTQRNSPHKDNEI